MADSDQSDHSDAEAQNIPPRKAPKKKHAKKISKTGLVVFFVTLVILAGSCLLAREIMKKYQGKVIEEYAQFKEEVKRITDRAKFEKEVANEDVRVKEAKVKFQLKNQFGQIMTNKWLADPSRFEGVEKFLNKTKLHESYEEESLYLSRPMFVKQEGNAYKLEWIKNTTRTTNYPLMHDINDRYVLMNIQIMNADLRIFQTLYFNGKQERYNITRFYYVPASDLLSMF